DLADRIKCGQRVVAHIFSGDGGDDLTGGHDAEGVAVGLRSGHCFVADDTAGSGLVFNDDPLSELGLPLIGGDASRGVPAPPPGPNDLMIRIGLCGQSCATACDPKAATSKADASRAMILRIFIFVSPAGELP